MLRIDLFDLVDGLFRGVVYFFYNIFETIVYLVRRPFRGPLRLYRRRRHRAIRQLAGPTFLFLCFFTLFSIYHLVADAYPYDGEPKIGAGLAAAIARTPSLNSDWVWMVLATSLAGTVAVDAVLRLALSSPRFGGQARRALVIESVEYALFWPILLLLGLSVYPPTAFGLFDETTGEPTAALFAVVPALLLALVPAALLLAAVVRTPRMRRGALLLRRLASLGVTTVLMSIAMLVSISVDYMIVSQREEQDLATAEQPPMVLDLDCALSGPVPHVDALIWNRRDEPTVQQAFHFEVHIAATRASFEDKGQPPASRTYPVRFADLVGRVLLLRAGQTRRIRLLVPGYRYRLADQGRFCWLRIYPAEDAASLGRSAFGGAMDFIDPPASE